MFDLSLRRVIEQLRVLYGEPEAPPSADPLELILCEHVAYLVDYTRRAASLRPARGAAWPRPLVDCARRSAREQRKLARRASRTMRRVKLRQDAQFFKPLFSNDKVTL